MTRIFTLLAFIVCTTTLHAQISKGTILLGGQVSTFNTTSENQFSKGTSEGVSIDLSVGRAFRENSVFGLSINYAPGKQTTRYNSNYPGDSSMRIDRYYDIGAGAFFRRYKSLGKDFYFFTQAAGGASYGKVRASEEQKDTKVRAYVQLTPGISYQVLRSMQLEVSLPGLLGLHYVKTKIESKGEQTQKSRDISFSSNLTKPLESLGVGFRFTL